MKLYDNVLKIMLVLLIINPVLAAKGKSNDNSAAIAPMPNQPFNPDEADGIYFQEMRAQFGAIPKPAGATTLGAVAKAFENEYWRIFKSGMEAAVDKLQQHDYPLKVDVRSAQGEGDEQGQLAILKNMINQRYTALLLSPISDGNLIPGVEDALQAGIPVVNVNDGIINIAPNFVGTRAIEEGQRAAEWIAKQIGMSGKTAIVIGMPKAFAARQRTIGFENWMAANAPNVTIVEKQNADWDRAKAKDLTEIWLKKHPDLRAIFCNNDTMALGVQEAVNGSGRDVLVVGVDGVGEAYESIKKGEMAATIDSFPYFKGQVAIEVGLRVLGGQQLPRVIWTPIAVIDRSNVQMTASELINWQEPELVN